MVDRELGSIVLFSGLLLLAASAVGIAVDTIFAGCISTGPCQPVPPLPLFIFILTLGIGVGLAIGALALRRPRRT
jgi:hypothetical protein